MAICGGPVASFGRAPGKRLSGYRVARPYRRGLRVLYGFSIRRLSSHYGYLGETLGRSHDLCCGSLLRNLVNPTLVESENFAVGAWGATDGAVPANNCTPGTKGCFNVPTQQQQNNCGPSQRIGSAVSHVVHDLDLLAVNGSMFVASGGLFVAGGLAISGGCLEPTPAEPLTCAAGIFAGAHAFAGETVSGTAAILFFKNYTLPAIKNWGCED